MVPSWIAGGPPPVQPQRVLRAQARGKRRAAAMLALASAFSLIAAIAAYATVGELGLPDAPRVKDEEFLSLAAAACNEAAGDVAEIPRPEAGDSAQRTARYVERVSDRYDELVGDLSVLPIAKADRDAVREWTTSFAAYTEAGRRYAATLRAEDNRAGADSVRRQGNPYKRELTAFAFRNQLPETCIPV